MADDSSSNRLSTAQLNSLWGYLIVEECIRNGANHFFLTPGSRSTPLAAQIASNPKAQHVIGYDERSVAFAALGHSKATRTPGVLVVTSGTALANLYPAIIEASQTCTPLLVLTADRPHELRRNNANQSIDQNHMFGNFVRYFVDLPVPTDEIPASWLLSTMDDVCSRTLGPIPGPVHVNCPLREPFLPLQTKVRSGISSWDDSANPYTRVFVPSQTASLETIDWLWKHVTHTERGLLVIGSIQNSDERKAAFNIAQKLLWPTFVDVGSGLKFSGLKTALPMADQMLLASSSLYEYNPNTVMQLGGRLVSKRISAYIDAAKAKNKILIEPYGQLLDVSSQFSARVTSDFKTIYELIQTRPLQVSMSSSTLDLVAKSKELGGAIKNLLAKETSLTEPFVAQHLIENFPKDCAFLPGTSMPIRDVEMLSPFGKIESIVTNRGASGIDGLVSTAIGYSIGVQKPLVALLGDLSFLHDVNGLSLLQFAKNPIVFVVINNQGGGIFSFLPIANNKEVFSPFFDSPHDFRLGGCAKCFGVDHIEVTTKQQWIDCCLNIPTITRHLIIEVKSNRQNNFMFHETLKKVVIRQQN